jgi:hypothetical protein
VAEPYVRELAQGLLERGLDVAIVSSHAGRTRRSDEDGVEVVHLGRLPERPLASRAFDGPITQIPRTIKALAGFQVAHAFSPQDAFAASYGAAAVAFTCMETPRREELAERRLRLRFWEHAADPGHALLAPGEATRRAVWRWLAVDAQVIAAGDAEGHERVYRRQWESACR